MAGVGSGSLVALLLPELSLGVIAVWFDEVAAGGLGGASLAWDAADSTGFEGGGVGTAEGSSAIAAVTSLCLEVEVPSSVFDEALGAAVGVGVGAGAGVCESSVVGALVVLCEADVEAAPGRRPALGLKARPPVFFSMELILSEVGKSQRDAGSIRC